jgi:O-methyltransferase involved in polyketide biosynthesis
MTAIELGSVQKTLLLPLWGRAVETGKAHPLLVDRAAAEIIAAIDYDFSTIARNISPITQLAWIARSLHTDRTIREFLARDAGATIVNLGCGLDTTFERVDNGRLRWVDLDMPDVMELRKRFIPESARRRSIACSLLDEGWLRQVTAPALFVAAGVLYYLDEAELKTLFRRLADASPGAEVLFDACSPRGLRMANKKVIEGGGMDRSATLKWALRRARDLESWDSRIAVLAEYGIFQNFKDGLSIGEKVGTTISDALRIMSMVHLRLGRGGDCACRASH